MAILYWLVLRGPSALDQRLNFEATYTDLFPEQSKELFHERILSRETRESPSFTFNLKVSLALFCYLLMPCYLRRLPSASCRY